MYYCLVLDKVPNVSISSQFKGPCAHPCLIPTQPRVKLMTFWPQVKYGC